MADMTRLEELLEQFSTHDAALARIAELEAALREIADVAEAGFADAKSSCRTEVKAIAHAARQVLR